MKLYQVVFSFLIVVSCAEGSRLHIDVALGPPVDSQPITSNFIGFSLQIAEAINQLRLKDAGGQWQVHGALLQMLRNLHEISHPARSGGAISPGPVLRLGGTSADNTCFEYPPKTEGCSYNLTISDLATYRRFAKSALERFGMNLPFVLGTNLGGAVNPKVAARLIRVLTEQHLWDAPVALVEIGNEVDSYSETHPKSKLETASKYANEFAEYLKEYHAAGMGQLRVQGGAFSSIARPGYDLSLKGYLQRFNNSLATISMHDYPSSRCGIMGNMGRKPVKLQELLSRFASASQADLYRQIAKETRGSGKQLWLGELNSVGCGEDANVSDTLGSALWAVDYLSEMSKAGVTGVNFHSSFHGGSNTPCSLTSPFCLNQTSGVPDVRPLYYGLLLFTELVSNRSVWLEAAVRHKGFPLLGSNSYVHAVQDDNHIIRVAVIVKETHHDIAHLYVNVEVTRPIPNASAWCTTATAARLTTASGATNLTARNGILWAGMSFDNSKDGRPTGARAEDAVEVTTTTNEQVFVFKALPASAVLLTIRDHCHPHAWDI
ncbi:hypothetical protein CYMTET_42214 [Cymbomonas tetramitiformis]|uniref:Uncharacterized protein n=1 Tax=Cymbomonas tetramitiformis TaxID=36881 RepID=A0AAE0F1W1_9CHLO|nr:hypothetical protein CYMTET_42214 [Cymbomonas tetramitiformis]|eukprot:gene19864-23762_t